MSATQKCWVCGEECDGTLSVPVGNDHYAYSYEPPPRPVILPEDCLRDYAEMIACPRCHAEQQSLKLPVERERFVDRLKRIALAAYGTDKSPAGDETSIRIWRFDDAPQVLQNLSENGGDEDWLALIPAGMKDEWIGWLDSPSFGCSSIDEFCFPDGRRVMIGSHA